MTEGEAVDVAATAMRGGAYVRGAWQRAEGTSSWPVVSPATGAVLSELGAASPGQVSEAVASARSAFDEGHWRTVSPQRRAEYLRSLAEELRRRAHDLAPLVTAETGTPISLSMDAGVGAAVKTLEWYADAAVRGPYGSYDHAVERDASAAPTAGINRYEPLGVVGAIVPYNFPLNMLAWKVGGALAAGCATVALPSPRSTLSTIAFFEALETIDLPPGAVNLVVGGADVGQRLTTDERVDLISFTGSVEVGRQIMAASAPRLTRLVLELGGKNPMIVLPSADAQAAAAAAVPRFVTNAGQMCGSTTRLFVPADRCDEFTDACAATMGSLRVVDPWHPDTLIGPLISAQHRDRAEGFLRRAQDAGGTVMVGGDRPEPADGGFYLNPALVTGLPNDAELNQEELFAPIAAVLPYADVDDAVEQANASRYGLNSVVYGDHDEAVAVARRLRVGTVSINSLGTRRPDAPWGGFKMSGIGRELGDLGFSQFFELQHVQWSAA